MPMAASTTNSMIRLGVLGYGYWGPNIVRNLHGLDGCQVALVCDKSAAALKRLKQAYPDQAVTKDPSELLKSTEIDAVAVVTPVCSHFELAKAALLKIAGGLRTLRTTPAGTLTSIANQIAGLSTDLLPDKFTIFQLGTSCPTRKLRNG